MNYTGIKPSDFTLTWNQEGEPLNVNESIIATFTLTITSKMETPTSFTFDIIVDDLED